MYSKEDRKIISKIGYYQFHKMKELNFSYEEYEYYKIISRHEMKKTQNQKNKTRFKTIRYLERHCNIERKCQICGAKAEIHHPDYNNYLKINLLCKKHHTDLHNNKLKQPEIIDLKKFELSA